MNYAQAKIARILAEIKEELSLIIDLQKELNELNQNEKSYLRALASIFHDYYSGIEKIFKKIAEELNGGIPNSNNWHRDLLHEMAMEIPNLRPPVLTKKTELIVLEFLKFRHLFRNIYGFYLDESKLNSLKDKFPSSLELFQKDIYIFMGWLESNIKKI